ncbi:alpha/beta hydrolase family protein [Streptosporangium sp. NBC_01639]|uniref:alpha/beta hydrolase n=1 Tax=Streptosporangium sp. NBC_01639 TaxID=2975948 RepID=UPI003867CE3D|nr:alpha/beta hydrolase family protein [Streptosporangium sp. NBC_01639]
MFRMFRRTLAVVTTAALTYVVVPAPPGDRVVRVYGDLRTAEHVAVVVPGSDTTVASFDGGRAKAYSTPGGGAKAVLAEARALGPGARLAVVAWLGYDSPATVSLEVVTDGAAGRGAVALRRYLAETLAGKRVSLLCHSYGSVVCAKAAPGSGVASMVAVGSPGLGVSAAAELGDIPLWVGSGSRDWMRDVPKLRIGPLGFGPDPADPSFGARLFATGDAGHSDYFAPGGVSLRNLTLIALGRTGEVSRG